MPKSSTESWKKKAITTQNPPSLVEVETFWSKIWENSKTHNDAAHWIQDRAKENQHVPTQEYTTNLPMPTTISSRTQNSPQSGWPRVWLSWYQTSKTQGTLKTTGLSHAYQLCTRPWPPSLQKGPTNLSKVTTCSLKSKKDAAGGAMAAKTSSSSTKQSLRRWDPRAVISPRPRLTTRRPSTGCPTSGSSRASNSTRSAPLSPTSCGKTRSRGRRSSA